VRLVFPRYNQPFWDTANPRPDVVTSLIHHRHQALRIALQRVSGLALKAYRDSLVTAERLAASDRSNAEWQSDLDLCHSGLAYVYENLGDIAQALAEVRKGRSSWRRAILVSILAQAGTTIVCGQVGEGLRR
jgi:hypothetical protein